MRFLCNVFHERKIQFEGTVAKRKLAQVRGWKFPTCTVVKSCWIHLSHILQQQSWGTFGEMVGVRINRPHQSQSWSSSPGGDYTWLGDCRIGRSWGWLRLGVLHGYCALQYRSFIFASAVGGSSLVRNLMPLSSMGKSTPSIVQRASQVSTFSNDSETVLSLSLRYRVVVFITESAWHSSMPH
jgi:hypothetical protein